MAIFPQLKATTKAKFGTQNEKESSFWVHRPVPCGCHGWLVTSGEYGWWLLGLCCWSGTLCLLLVFSSCPLYEFVRIDSPGHSPVVGLKLRTLN